MIDPLDSLQRMIFALWGNDVSRAFSIAIITYFIFAVLFANSTGRRARALIAAAPASMASLGILGTFLGVFLGLLDFDIRTINRSVPLLLEGLKVAFGTSILGLFGAVTYRMISPIITRNTMVSSDATINDIVNQLTSLEQSVVDAANSNSQGLELLQSALTDDKDTSIVGQLQRLRGSISDLDSSVRKGFEEQIGEFKNFAEHMSEAFSKAIIEELKSVIREFNEKISEQFGDNFKQLNEAVGRLVEWQEQYRRQMDELAESLKHAVGGVEACRDALNEIQHSTEKLPSSIEQMERANKLLDEQILSLTEHLGKFAEIGERASSAFPQIEANIEQLTENLRQAATNQSEVVEAISEDSRSIISDLQEAGEAMTSQVARVSASISTSVQSMGQEVQDLVRDTMAEQRTTQQEMLTGLQTSFNETISSATNQMNEAIIQLDEAMQNEIESVIRAMAENLSGISEKFVADYEPLLVSTRRIVEIGERAGRHE